MNQATHYLELARMSQDAFVRAAAAAALVRRRQEDDPPFSDVLDTVAITSDRADAISAVTPFVASLVQVFPLAKKRGAPFADMITLGRTTNNDVLINHVTVSRLHAFFRRSGEQWSVADAGSKNGTFVEKEQLAARKDRFLQSGGRLRFGDVRVTFYTAGDLYGVLRDSLAAVK